MERGKREREEKWRGRSKENYGRARGEEKNNRKKERTPEEGGATSISVNSYARERNKTN